MRANVYAYDRNGVNRSVPSIYEEIQKEQRKKARKRMEEKERKRRAKSKSHFINAFSTCVFQSLRTRKEKNGADG